MWACNARPRKMSWPARVTSIVCSTLWYSASLLPMHSSAMRAIDGTSSTRRVSATAIQRLRFLKRPIGLEPERAHSKIACARFQHFENAPSDAETARVGGDPHALDLGDHPILEFERTAADRPTAEAGDDEDAGGRREFIGVRGDALCRVEAGFEPAGQLAKILFEAPARIGAVRRFHRYLNGRRAHQSLDLGHRRDQAIPLRDAERGQHGTCEHVGATIELSDFAQPRSGQSHATDTAIVRRRLRAHQPLTLERAQEAT